MNHGLKLKNSVSFKFYSVMSWPIDYENPSIFIALKEMIYMKAKKSQLIPWIALFIASLTMFGNYYFNSVRKIAWF
jgi:hypothetical protein